MATAVERFAARLIKLENRIDGLATGPQLGYSSLEDGSLEEYDGDGQLVTIIGKQPDGTHGAVVVSGPIPPRPSAAVVSGGPGLLNYGWDGNFADEGTGETDITIPAPMDWARTEAHASKLQGFSADTAATLLDTLESPRGGTRTAMLEPGTWFVVLVSRASSGKRSKQSLEVEVEVLPPVGSDIDVEALKEEFRAVDAEMNAAIQQNRLDQDALAGTVSGLRDTTLPGLNTDLALAKERLASAETAISTAIPSQINTAKNAAITSAATDATAKKEQAQAAAALDAKAKADKALADAKADATTKANNAKTAAVTAAAADAKAQAEAAEARAATAAAADAKVKADAAQEAALAAAKTYAETQASGASGAALEAAKLDATTKANAAEAAAKASAALDATTKKEQAEANAAVDAKTKADKALADAKVDAKTKADAAKDAAIAAAAADATAKKEQAEANAAADAKKKADQALADAKADAAAQVQVVVNTIMGQTYYGTAVPSASVPGGSIKAGSTYRRKNAAGQIIGEYEYTGSVWVARVMTADTRTAIDVGELTVGSAAILDVVAQKIAASTAAFQTVDIGKLFVTGTSALNTVTAQRIAANVGQFLSVSTDQLTAGSASLGTAVAEKFYAEVVAGRKFYAEQIVVGHPGNILPDPMFLDPGMIARRNTASTCTVYKSGPNLGLNNTSAGTTYFRPLGVKQDTLNYMGWVPVKPGEVWTVELATDAFKGAGVLKFVGRTMDGSAYKNPTGSTAVVAGSASYKYVGTIPEDCYWICPELSVPPGVSYIKAGSMTMQQVVTPALVVDGLMNGQRIVGASIETSLDPNQGVKLTTAGGLVAHSETRDYDPVAQKDVPYNTKAILSQRNVGWTQFPSDLWPGLWFESVREDGLGPAVKNPAGLMASGAHGFGVSLQSSQLTDTDYRSSVTADQNFVTITAQSARATKAVIPDHQTNLSVFSQGWSLRTVKRTGTGTSNASETLATFTNSDGAVNLESKNGVQINGSSVGGDSGWMGASYVNGWANYGNGFSGLQYRRKDGVLYLRGSIKGGGVGSVVSTLPKDFRPITPPGTQAMEFGISVVQGGIWYAGTMYAYSDGRLLYSAAPGVWSGADRVVIHATFPL